MSKQIRVTDMQYKILGQLSDSLGISRIEILSNAINLTKLLIDNKATAVKVICEDGKEKELLLTLLVNHDEN